jgi:hypothetical protein
VREFHEAVSQAEMALVIFFCSSSYDLEALGDEMRSRFSGVLVVGCTTFGEIGPCGYTEHSLTGASFAAHDFWAVSGCVENLQGFTVTDGNARTQELLRQLERQTPQNESWKSFGLMLIDGLSMREEIVTRCFQDALGHIPLAGGSASNYDEIHSAQVYADGIFHPNSAVLTLISTRLPFKLFKTQNFVTTEQRMVITEADPSKRKVMEINGLPAAKEYGRMVGMDADNLGPYRFAAWPLVVLIDGTSYVRSIKRVNVDNSLSFWCAIEDGLVLRVARSVNLVENLEQAYAEVRAKIGAPQLVIVWECCLRKVEINRSSLAGIVGEIHERNNAVGFVTFGEQLQGVHINQTLVGIAIGEAQMEASNAGGA